MPKLSNYPFSEHLHRYAVWTAARAVQRGFTTTKNIQQAIVQAELEQQLAVLAKAAEISPAEFDTFHRTIAKKLIDSLSTHVKTVTYGRAAKIIAIYIKTSQVIPNPASAISRVAHPPIDRILLQNLANQDSDSFKNLKEITWTTLEEDDYFEVINKLRPICKGEPFWKLEMYWEAG